MYLKKAKAVINNKVVPVPVIRDDNITQIIDEWTDISADCQRLINAATSNYSTGLIAAPAPIMCVPDPGIPDEFKTNDQLPTGFVVARPSNPSKRSNRSKRCKSVRSKPKGSNPSKKLSRKRKRSEMTAESEENRIPIINPEVLSAPVISTIMDESDELINNSAAGFSINNSDHVIPVAINNSDPVNMDLLNKAKDKLLEVLIPLRILSIYDEDFPPLSNEALKGIDEFIDLRDGLFKNKGPIPGSFIIDNILKEAKVCGLDIIREGAAEHELKVKFSKKWEKQREKERRKAEKKKEKKRLDKRGIKLRKGSAFYKISPPNTQLSISPSTATYQSNAIATFPPNPTQPSYPSRGISFNHPRATLPSSFCSAPSITLATPHFHAPSMIYHHPSHRSVWDYKIPSGEELNGYQLTSRHSSIFRKKSSRPKKKQLPDPTTLTPQQLEQLVCIV